MDYCRSTLIPYIPAAEYDKIATEFLESYYPEGLLSPISIPILDIARNEIGLNVEMVYLSEELDVYGMTIFTDGCVDIYIPEDGIYETRIYKGKTVLIDPEAYKKTNEGCVNNTIAHECVHWYKHRMYYKMQAYTLPRYAKYCKCRVNQLSFDTQDEVMENHAVGIAPRILMPKIPFEEKATELGVQVGQDNGYVIAKLAEHFKVSKQSVKIRLEECSLI